MPAPGNPRGMLYCAQVMFRFCPTQLPGSCSLRSPAFILSVSVVLRNDPVSTFWRCTSKPTKKNALSRLLFHSTPGMMIGPPMLPPG